MKDKHPLISVIIPVFNVAPYLNRCMETIVSQTYTNLQIIMVDDGSTDFSGSLCDQWKKADNRIKVIHKKNEGLGMARNSGIKAAEGEYFLFVDSDDYVDKVMAEKLLQTLVIQQADICYSGFVDVSINGEERAGVPPEKLIYSGDEIMADFIGEALGAVPETSRNCFAGMSACAALYRASLFREEEVFFRKEEKVLCEDLFFNIAICRYARKVVLLPECFYYYCANESSLTKRYKKDRYEVAKHMKRLLDTELKDCGAGNISFRQRIDRNYMDNLITCMKQEVAFRKQNGKDWCMRRLKEMAEDETTLQVLKTYPIKKMEKKQRILFTMILTKNMYVVYWLFRLRYRLI